MLDINYNLDCMNKGEVISSESNDYMGRPGKGLMTSLALSTKGQKKKQKEWFAINDITN